MNPNEEPSGYGLAHPFGPEPEPEAVAAARWWELSRTPRRPWRRTALATVLGAAAVLALGAPFGLLWAWLAPSVPVINTGSGIVINDSSPEEYIAADGWYTLLGLGFGLLVGIAAWMLMRRDRGPFLLLGVVAGALGAGYLVAPWIGEMIGRDDYRHWSETAGKGATFLAPPEVHSTGPLLVPAFAAAIVLTLLSGWSNDPDLDQPGARPGYGPNTPTTEDGWPDPTQARPGLAQPGPGQSGLEQPGWGQPGLEQPAPGQPGLAQPGPGQPGLEQPGPGQSGLAQPGPGQSGLGQPGPGQPGPGQPRLERPAGPAGVGQPGPGPSAG
ncbi:hypothetical protein GCM10010172_58450 [Paractinoplanes ferrugineus]|uniref:Uncharacterized protein n=1 Tax=Paractinoplanes ferrugineus TaxID=113564 RepID=A0A919J654_9ACTN|nr:hypothetical protein [Actinoplanes ferrugineus]GIE14309.1 hypothetical protein Afe05nite_61490 [Actinoplanes ferrugineus]